MAAWPTVNDLIAWVRSESVAPSSDAMLSESFDAADELIRDRIDSELLLTKAARAGIITDPLAVGYDAAVVAAWCPSYVRQAILIRAASLFTRRDSANGTISFGDFAATVRSMDPDVEDLLSPVEIPVIG